MDLASYRKARGLSQQSVALELGLSSKGYISGIETRSLTAPLELALKIEQWSGGQVTAAELNPTAAKYSVGVRA